MRVGQMTYISRLVERARLRRLCFCPFLLGLSFCLSVCVSLCRHQIRANRRWKSKLKRKCQLWTPSISAWYWPMATHFWCSRVRVATHRIYTDTTHRMIHGTCVDARSVTHKTVVWELCGKMGLSCFVDIFNGSLFEIECSVVFYAFGVRCGVIVLCEMIGAGRMLL